ncbi:trigger factor [Thermosipho atlanticus]|uniref:Cell division topological specificity factor n=1 Tax=Thermosipho atlanticus DSM 15807 TaxID=1123380 RepID=A0A1M5R4L5_9BACT|nr:trigger factor [Thermosipho atlanticus]SHH21335.1 cell division topological specificity factor [Thermosipho atlanticus DSM 15807]
MWLLDIFKKNSRKHHSKDEALKRLENMISRRREITHKVPIENFSKNSEEIKKELVKVVSEKFHVPLERVKVDCQEQDGYVIIVTNINFK